MKWKILFAAAVVVSLVACTQKDGEWPLTEKSAWIEFAADGNSYVNATTLSTVFTTNKEDLTDAEIAGLLRMREEEKMAREVYLKMNELWGAKSFENIAKSELTHANAVLALLTHFEIADPASSEIGVFADVAIQKLYNELVAAGAESALKALETGAFIEELDILDLEKLLDETTNEDLELVYGNLLKGSRNHLRAFVRQIGAAGDTYSPFLMSPEYFNEIISSKMENGNGNSGKRYGYQNAGNGKQGNSYADCVNSGTGGLGSGTCDGTGVATGGKGKQGNGKGKGRN